MKNKIYLISMFFIIFTFCIFYVNKINASTTGYTTLSLNVRKGPGTNYEQIVTLKSGASVTIFETVNTNDNSSGCPSNKWHKIDNGYVCSDYVTATDLYDRPWTSPKKSIIGGAKFIARNYIAKGQFTSYLKRFNINPKASYAVYTHQYMTNLRAVYSESRTSYTSYYQNKLLEQPLVFSIPVYLDMPDNTNFGDYIANVEEQEEVTDQAFETLLDNQKFPDSYKKKLRILHNLYPNWTFEAMHTNLKFADAVKKEQPVSYVDGGDTSLRYKNSSGDYVLKEGKSWYLANNEAVAYFMDPRNFLKAENILMFEDLSSSEIHTELVVQTILNSTFMSGKSLVDDQTYASIFVEASKTADVSAVYLASLVKQEVGVNGSVTTTGVEFTYDDVTYKGLYNFYNIGAYSSAINPPLAGLVFANGSATSTIVKAVNNTIVNEYESGNAEVTPDELTTLSSFGLVKIGNYIGGIKNNTTLQLLQEKNKNTIISILDNNGKVLENNSKIGTGNKVTIKGTSDYVYSVIVKGDLNGDGVINSADLLKMRQHLLGISILKNVYFEAGNIANDDNTINSAELLKMRQYLLGITKI